MLNRLRPCHDAWRERGSVLFLYPAGFLAMLTLGAIAVDTGNAYLHQRELADAADAAANDAVTYGLDQDILRTTGQYVLDPDRVDEAVLRSLSQRGILDDVDIAISAPILNANGQPEITVTLGSTVDHIFGPIVPGIRTTSDIHATGTADARYQP